MGLRVKEGEESESFSVMGKIGVEPSGGDVSVAEWQHHPTRKRADFRLVLRHEKVDGNVETGVRRIGSTL
jgi:hypothetical protein